MHKNMRKMTPSNFIFYHIRQHQQCPLSIFSTTCQIFHLILLSNAQSQTIKHPFTTILNVSSSSLLLTISWHMDFVPHSEYKYFRSFCIILLPPLANLSQTITENKWLSTWHLLDLLKEEVKQRDTTLVKFEPHHIKSWHNSQLNL